MLLNLLPSCFLLVAVHAAETADWKLQSIYQVITDRFALSNGSTTAQCDTGRQTYCGGSWQGIIKQLDYIENMGFTAIWISPVVRNIGNGYHGYWAQDIYALNENFGTMSDLKALSKALHDRNMLLMVDVVVNHMSWNGTAAESHYNTLTPFNNSGYFHPFCDIAQNITECWVTGYYTTPALPDLDTEGPDVRNIFHEWITGLVTDYDIDGLRIDTVKNVESSFFPVFSKASGVFCTGEVLDSEPSVVCPYTQVLDSALNYPVYFPLIDAFSSPTNDMSKLVEYLTSIKSSCKDPTTMGSFSENHDQPRFPSYTSDLTLAKNVLVFTFFADGIPIIYQGQEQHLSGGASPANREAIWLSTYNATSPLYLFISSLNTIRQHMIAVAASYLNYNSYVTYNDSNTIVMRKGFDGSQVITVLNNAGSMGPTRNFTLTNAMTGFNPGDLVTDLVSCLDGYIDNNGNILVTRKEGLPSIYYAKANIQGTAICANDTITDLYVVSSSSTLSGGSTSSTSKVSLNHTSGSMGMLSGLSGTIKLMGLFSLSCVMSL